jgi:hypothetical protein
MWRELCFHNELLDRGVRRLLSSGIVRISIDSGLIELKESAKSMNYDGNWLFFGHNTAMRDCYLWHQVMFNYFDSLVPDFCRFRCWKVVVKTRNFRDAIGLHNAVCAGPQVAGDLMPIQGKVGIDERWYTHGHFNGFIYCDGPEDAERKFLYIRKLVDTCIPDGKNIDVIIKRSCTEFERMHGPTDGDFWKEMSPEDIDLQHRVEDMVQGMKGSSVQPDWVKNRIISRMVKWANSVGDTSWVEYFGGTDILTMKAVTYHQHLLEKGESQGAKQIKAPKKTKAKKTKKH